MILTGGKIFGWQSVYWISAGFMLLLAVVLEFFLPEFKPASPEHVTYGQLLKPLWTLFIEKPQLRKASLFGAALFGSWNNYACIHKPSGIYLTNLYCQCII